MVVIQILKMLKEREGSRGRLAETRNGDDEKGEKEQNLCELDDPVDDCDSLLLVWCGDDLCRNPKRDVIEPVTCEKGEMKRERRRSRER